MEGIKKAGIKIHLDSLVVEYDYIGTRLSVKPFLAPDSDRRWVEADVILASDGVKSIARSGMLKRLGDVDHSRLFLQGNSPFLRP